MICVPNDGTLGCWGALGRLVPKRTVTIDSRKLQMRLRPHWPPNRIGTQYTTIQLALARVRRGCETGLMTRPTDPIPRKYSSSPRVKHQSIIDRLYQSILRPKYISVISTFTCRRRSWICSTSPPVLRQSFAQIQRRSWGASLPSSVSRAYLTTDLHHLSIQDGASLHHTSLGRGRKVRPSANPADIVQISRLPYKVKRSGTVRN